MYKCVMLLHVTARQQGLPTTQAFHMRQAYAGIKLLPSCAKAVTVCLLLTKGSDDTSQI
jgi:hypothetical protein